MENVPTFVFDLETSPLITYSWGLGKQFLSIDQLIEDPRILCWAGKYRGEKKVYTGAEWLDGGRAKMLEDLHGHFDKAEVRVHYNGGSFDVPWVFGEFIKEGMAPPSPALDLDLYRQIRNKVRLPSYRLQYVATHLFHLPGKAETGGFSLWKDVLAGDPRARAKMLRYNIRDTNLTDEVLEAGAAWWKYPTNQITDGMTCSRLGCPGGPMQRRGYRRTSAGLYARFQCMTCKGWAQQPRIIQTMEGRNIA